jgi:hypothetical protein
LIAVMLASVPASAEPDRVAYVTRALAAVRGLGSDGRERLDREMYAAARASCHTDTACLVAAATAICGPDATCRAATDVIAVNLRAANDWVDEPTRVRLVRSSSDYRVALADELRRHFAALATELVLAGGGDDAVAIDRLCRERDAVVHACRPQDAACVPSVPWSRCVAALVWFVGGAR